MKARRRALPTAPALPPEFRWAAMCDALTSPDPDLDPDLFERRDTWADANGVELWPVDLGRRGPRYRPRPWALTNEDKIVPYV